jgi:hypothetical protein
MRERDEQQTGYNIPSSLASTSVIRAVHFQNMNLAAVLIPPSLPRFSSYAQGEQLRRQ